METQTNSSSQPITKRLSQAWPAFTRKLADVLAHLGEDQYLVISAKSAHRYVQFAGQGSFGLRAEATSNHYLAAGDRLTRRQLAALKSRGWLAPSGSAKASTLRKDPDGSPNFYVDFELPVPFGEVAELAVDTFSTIFGITHPGELEYSAFEADGETTLLPTLGLKRTQENATSPTRDELQPRLQNALRAVTGIDDLQPDDGGRLQRSLWRRRNLDGRSRRPLMGPDLCRDRSRRHRVAGLAGQAQLDQRRGSPSPLLPARRNGLRRERRARQPARRDPSFRCAQRFC